MPDASLSFLTALTGWGLLAATVIVALRGVHRPDRAPLPAWIWGLLLAAVLLCFRWPVISLAHALYPDESQLLTGAITLRHDPLFWRSVDGGTAGPVDYFALLPATWFPGADAFVAARVIATGCVWAVLFATGETLVLLTGLAVTRLAVLPALAWSAFTTSPELLHYSSELMPLVLLATALLVLARQWVQPRRRNLWLAGILLGSVPLAKLQAAPIAAALGLAWIALEIRARRPRHVGIAIAGALLPAGLTVLVLAATGELEHMVIPYISQNLLYAGSGRLAAGAVAGQLWIQSVTNGYHAAWLAGSMLFCLVAGIACLRRPHPRAGLLAGGAGLLLISAACVLAPGRPYHHYLHLLTPGVVLLSGLALAVLWPGEKTVTAKLALAGAFLAIGFVPAVALRLADRPDPYAYYNQVASAPTPEQRQLLAQIAAHSQPGESLGVWGWRLELYVESDRWQATCQAHVECLLITGPAQKYYLRRYYEKLAENAPPVFVDTVGPRDFRFHNRALDHELYPLLRDFIRERYVFVGEFDAARVYVRRDRLKSAAVD